MDILVVLCMIFSAVPGVKCLVGWLNNRIQRFRIRRRKNPMAGHYDYYARMASRRSSG